MFSHVMVGSNDLDRSKRFYDRLLGQEAHVQPNGRLVYRRNGGVFMVTKPIDGEAAQPGNGGTIGFNLESPEDVDAWHRTGSDAGGTPVEDAPGYRTGPSGKLYLAYLRDPDGNKLCGLHRPQQ